LMASVFVCKIFLVMTVVMVLNLKYKYIILIFYVEVKMYNTPNSNLLWSYPFGIISLAHVPVNVTDFSIGSINCNPNNADRGRNIIIDVISLPFTE
jgi:hypothetical protein